MSHPLFKRNGTLPNGSFIWTLRQHAHRIVGDRRGFQVRLYQDDNWADPYLVTMTAQENGFVMFHSVVPSAAAADAAAFELLALLDGTLPDHQEH